MPAQPVLETDRLILRPFEPADAPLVQVLAGAREIADTTLTIPHPYPDGTAAAWIATHEPAWQAGSGATYAITRRGARTLVGAIGLHIIKAHGCAELGYWIAVAHWNQGYCTEAVRAVAAFGFDSLKLHRIQARHFTRNASSGRVMQKAGMRYEGVLRGAIRKWDAFEDVAVYGLLASDAASGTDSRYEAGTRNEATGSEERQ
jgi:RimJ/RimL family protein N-acetyltransferase